MDVNRLRDRMEFLSLLRLLPYLSIFDYVEKDDRVCGVVVLDSNVSDDRMYRFSDNDYLMDIWYDGVTRLQNNAEEQSTGGQSTEK